MLITVSALFVVAAFVCAVFSLATGKVHPSVAVLLLCVVEMLRLAPR